MWGSPRLIKFENAEILLIYDFHHEKKITVSVPFHNTTNKRENNISINKMENVKI